MTDTVLSPDEVAVAAEKQYQVYSLQVPQSYPERSDPPSKWNWTSHVCSAFTTLCCCWCLCCSSICGLIGLICAMSSYVDYKSGDYDQFRTKKTCSIVWTVIGLVMGLGALGGIAYAGYAYGPGLISQGQTYLNNFINGLIPEIPQQP